MDTMNSREDDELVARSPEVGQLCRLREVLALPSWPRQLAVAVLAGFVPDGNAANFGDLLPGHSSWKGMLENQIIAEIDELLTVAGNLLDRGVRPPAEWIKQAHDRGLPIVWIKAAMADPECRKLMPACSMAGVEAPTVAREKADTSSKTYKQHQTNASMHRRSVIAMAAIREKHFPEFLAMRKEGNRRTQAEFSRELAEQYPVEAESIANSLGLWLREQKRPRNDCAGTMVI